MKAGTYTRSGPPHRLQVADVEKPVPGDDEVLIKVHTASVNPLDYHLLKHPLLRRVMSRISKLKITAPGRDVAGTVEAIGKNVTKLKAGDHVFGACSGAFVEYACAGESALAIKPDRVSFEQAASVPVAGLTALQGLRDRGRIQTGQKVLVNGAAGGVGTFAVQIAKSFDAVVTGVCSTRNMELVRSLGADHVIDYTQEDFTAGGERYDLIFDLVANHSFSENRRVLTPRGMHIRAGALALGGSVDLLTNWIPELVLSPFVSQKFVSLLAKANQEDLRILGELVETGKITPVIDDRRFTLAEVNEAVSYVEEKHARGKVIIKIGEDM